MPASVHANEEIALATSFLTPFPLVPARKLEQTSNIPLYLLTDIFLYLDIHDLNRCRGVCADWNATILGRNVLKPKLFLQPPSPRDDLDYPVAMHPIFRKLKSDWSLENDPISICSSSAPDALSKPPRQFLHLLPVKDNFATSPALTRFIIMVPYHMMTVIENSKGVSVWDVAYGLKMLIHTISKNGALQYHRGCDAKMNGFKQLNVARRDCFNLKFLAQFSFYD